MSFIQILSKFYTDKCWIKSENNLNKVSFLKKSLDKICIKYVFKKIVSNKNKIWDVLKLPPFIFISAKGFICEICDNDHVIFPFEKEAAVCSQCEATFHKRCYARRINEGQECVRCVRIKAKKTLKNSVKSQQQQQESAQDQESSSSSE